MWAALGVVVAAGLIFAIQKYKDRVVSQPEQEQQDNDDSGSIIKVRRGIDAEINNAVHSLNREFKCGISCEKVQLLSADYNTKYIAGDKDYVGYQSLETGKCGEVENKYGCSCDIVSLYIDSYGCKVVRLKQTIPCFDSGDREYDSAHLLYFFHNGGQVHALYCGEGYRVATLTLFEKVKITNTRLINF